MSYADVHILRQGGHDNLDWLQECRESLQDQPVQVHETEGYPGHIGRARIRGYALGSAPYVAVVDPDDVVMPGAFQACIDALEADSNLRCAYTREVVIQEDGLLIAKFGESEYRCFENTPEEALNIHHLAVYRRSALPDLSFLERYPVAERFALHAALWAPDTFRFVNMIGYKWRRHRNQSTANHRRFFKTPEAERIMVKARDVRRRRVRKP